MLEREKIIMELMISRILKYLNGCLDDDHMYRIGNFVISHYTEMENYDLDTFLQAGNFKLDDLLDFTRHFGIDNYDDFKQRLLADHQSRLEQIHARMLNLDIEPFFDHLDTCYNKEELKKLIDEICDLIFKKNRIIIIGALYPSSVAVDFQTDLITLGKEVVEYHSFDNDFEFGDDVVFFITATGRLMEQNVKKLKPQNICEAYLVLITQNIKYREYENVCADYAIEVLGKFDGIQFNYQIMMIFDILRIKYYQKYYR